jgi:hypothetical protein
MPFDRKKPGVAFWATVVVVVAMLYLLSFGPFVWLYTRHQLPNRAAAAGVYVYYPYMVAGLGGGPEPFRSALNWYANLWVP